jgi:DNA-binding transcriptional LysR family regulator
MRRPTPPLQAIQAFLMAVRARSFRAAAQELSLSPSAFSRRIQSLEAFLGVRLYDRSGPVPRLTEVGERYCRELEPAIESICAATEAVRRTPRSGRLRLMCPPSFAINWLMPHLREYYDRHGADDVDVVISRDLDTLRLGRADLAIASGPRNFEGLLTDPFLTLSGAVVAAPTLAGGRRPPRSIADLAAHRLLGLDAPADLPQDIWQGWLTRIGYRGPILPEPLRFSTWMLMYEACANGMGVAIAVPAVAETYLRDGRLKPCFAGHIELGVQYNLVYASSDIQRRPDVCALVSWMTAAMRGSVTNYATFVGTAPLS